MPVLDIQYMPLFVGSLYICHGSPNTLKCQQSQNGGLRVVREGQRGQWSHLGYIWELCVRSGLYLIVYASEIIVKTSCYHSVFYVLLCFIATSLIELFVMSEMFHVCTVQYCSH